MARRKLYTDNGLDYPRTCIECEISFYDENNEHRKMSDVLKEIDNKCELLREWAKKLPNRMIIEDHSKRLSNKM